MKPIGINQVDEAVRKAMVAQGRLNAAAKEEGSKEQYCCACRSLVLASGARPGFDLPNSRWKMLEDRWTPVATLRQQGLPKFFVGIICEPCNWRYFTPEGISGQPYAGPSN